jgi:hypothetical protein
MVIIKVIEVQMDVSHPAKMVFFFADVEGGVDHGKKNKL